MKKFFAFAAVVASFALTSCTTISPLTATSNPVGKKCGEAIAVRYLNIFPFDAEVGIDKAVKNGNITRISHVDYYTKDFILWKEFGVRVYGE